MYLKINWNYFMYRKVIANTTAQKADDTKHPKQELQIR